MWYAYFMKKNTEATETDPTTCACGHAAHAHPYQSGPGMTWFDGCLDPDCECSSYRGAAVEVQS